MDAQAASGGANFCAAQALPSAHGTLYASCYPDGVIYPRFINMSPQDAMHADSVKYFEPDGRGRSGACIDTVAAQYFRRNTTTRDTS
eukprot:5134949-Pyramimonas_sp.AAC.1